MAPASVLLWLSISRGLANAHTSFLCPWGHRVDDDIGAGRGDDDGDVDGDVDDNLNELHMPASPNDIVQPNLVLPTKLHPKKPVPLRRRQLLAIRDRHALRYFFCQFCCCHGGPNLFIRPYG